MAYSHGNLLFLYTFKDNNYNIYKMIFFFEILYHEYILYYTIDTK